MRTTCLRLPYRRYLVTILYPRAQETAAMEFQLPRNNNALGYTIVTILFVISTLAVLLRLNTKILILRQPSIVDSENPFCKPRSNYSCADLTVLLAAGYVCSSTAGCDRGTDRCAIGRLDSLYCIHLWPGPKPWPLRPCRRTSCKSSSIDPIFTGQ